MNFGKRTAATAIGIALVVALPAAASGVKRPRPSDVPDAETVIAPNDYQLYNDYAAPERTYSSRRAVVHYLVAGIDAPPLNDDDADGVPDYVERVGAAADLAIAYYERRGFHPLLPDQAGPDARPDLYVSRFSPGTFGVAFPSARAEGGAFAVIANNLDPSPERSLASLYATVAHELFHLVQFSYFGPDADVPLPSWILEGTAAALETRVDPQLDDLVTTLQTRKWFVATERSITAQSYGAQLLWRWLDSEQPRFLPALFGSLARRPVAGDGRHAVAATYARVTGTPFAAAFNRFALSVATNDTTDVHTARETRRGTLAPLSVRYIRVAVPRSGRSALTVAFPRGRGGATSTIVLRMDSDIAGAPPRTWPLRPRVAGGGRRLSFIVSAGPRRSAVLVVSNGGEHRVHYAVGER